MRQTIRIGAPCRGERILRGQFMPGETITKTVIQHTAELDLETLSFLRGIAADYAKVKNAVYQKYSGISHVDSLTPIYGILNEMRYCGLRDQLKLPVVYYELAIADAVADIKTNWAVLRQKINGIVTADGNLTEDERMYIRTVLKINRVFSAILNRKPYEMPDNARELTIDTDRLNNRIRRMVRKYLTQPRCGLTQLFRVSPNGYRYGEGGIYLVSRIPRHRIFIPLRNDERYDRQILFIIEGNCATLHIPVETKIKKHGDYTGIVYMHIGSRAMFTLSDGTVYGDNLENIVFPETLRLDRKNQERGKFRRRAEQYKAENQPEKAGMIEDNNLGIQKYDSQKAKERATTVRYINTEINRMLREKKPACIVIPGRVVKNRTKHYSKTVNLKLARSFHGFIRERLAFKCRLNSVELVEVNAKGTGSLCANCGAEGKRWRERFTCENCGNDTTIALNTAKNVEKKFIKINSPDQRISG